MSKNKGIILGIVLIIVAIAIGAFEGYRLYTDNNTKDKKEEVSVSEDTTESEDDSYDDSYEDIDYEEETDETDETEETEDTVDFRIEGLNEEAYELLDTTEEDLATLLYEWTHNAQDYGTALGASFYPECEINFIDQKYTFSMTTIVGEEYPEESRTLILNYYKTSGQYEIH